ncbi:hypothetical protein AX15_004081 [Amanita polypyramis BW_CC]|nr:hypothetical protein AX15_004081 [Amanita polypyramis BW_CC]
MDHVLLYVPDIPKKYGGTGPDPLPALHIVAPCAPEAPAPPAAPALPPAPWSQPQATLLTWPPLAPPSCPPCTFAKAMAAPPSTPSVPKLAQLCKACTKQGTKSTMALLRPSMEGPPSNATAILDFMASKPLEALSLSDLEQLQAALDSFHHPGAKVVNHPTSTSLKFPHMPTIHPDGSAVSDSDLLVAICSHPHWQDISFVTPPFFIWPAAHPGDLSTLVFCEVRDLCASSTAHSLLKLTVNFFALQDTSFIKIACVNCSGPHTTTSCGCPFFTHCFNGPALVELQKACLHHLKEAQASKAASKLAKPSKGKSKA